MPNAAPHYCNEFGCTTLVSGQSKCPLHTKTRTRTDKRTDPFYTSPQWRSFRLGFIQKRPLCEDTVRGAIPCGKPANHVDHIVSIADGGARYEASNLQSLCHSCHSRKTATFDGGFGNKKR